MKIFLDSASLDEIRIWAERGLVDGVTTNPALLAREGADPLVQIKKIASIVSGPVSAQVTRSAVGEMVQQGSRLAAIGKNIVVKLPASIAGLDAAIRLHGLGIRINITLGFDAAQIVPFARVPVDFFSLIVGRVEDFGSNSSKQIAEARALLDQTGSVTELLVASIRNPTHLRAAIIGGADAVTVPPAAWTSIFSHPNTLQGIADFSVAWETLAQTLRTGYDSLSTEVD